MAGRAGPSSIRPRLAATFAVDFGRLTLGFSMGTQTSWSYVRSTAVDSTYRSSSRHQTVQVDLVGEMLGRFNF